MQRLAEEISEKGARPGIWFRPLWTKEEVPDRWLFTADRLRNTHVPRTLDPSQPEVIDLIARDVRRIVDWGYQLIKHDFTTFDICGWYGFEMGREITQDGWSFGDRSRTTAEVMLDLYRTIREAAGEAMVLGCNTVGHLGAGLFELQRTGDDTSGVEWERTRQRGVNTLAFRMPQQGTFFAADADCVGLTDKVDWRMNAQWLDLVARSGTPLFVSASPDAVGPDQRAALRDAFAVAATQLPPGEPMDWLETTCPSRWRLNGETAEYDWYGDSGAAFSYV
jgi:alpha-galactosidase